MPRRPATSTVVVAVLAGVSAAAQVLAGFDMVLALQLLFLLAATGAAAALAWRTTARRSVAIKKNLDVRMTFALTEIKTLLTFPASESPGLLGQVTRQYKGWLPA